MSKGYWWMMGALPMLDLTQASSQCSSTPANSLGHFVNKTTLISWALTSAQGSVFKRGGTSPSSSRRGAYQGTPPSIKILKLVHFQGDVVEEVLRIPAKSPFKRLILKTLLSSYLYSKMSSGPKSPPKGLKASEAEKGKLGVRPPIPYVPPNDLIKKWEGEQIKVKMPDSTNFSMATFTSSTNKEYLVHVIAVLCIIKKKGLAEDIKKA